MPVRPWGTSAPKCPACEKNVYAAEGVKALGRTWHGPCFCCKACGKSLRGGQYTDNDGVPYCVADYGKLFGTKGIGYGNTLGDTGIPASAHIALVKLCQDNDGREFKIREATKADAPFLAWVIQAASRGNRPEHDGPWDITFGTDMLAIFEQVILGAGEQTLPNFCHWSQFLIAEYEDNQPMAAVLGYDPKEGFTPFPVDLRAAMQKVGWSTETIDKFLPGNDISKGDVGWFIEAFPSFPEDRWQLEWVATRPEAQRKGLMFELLQAQLDVGRSKGFSKAQIAVFTGNDPARKTYEKVGFKINEAGTTSAETFEKHTTSKGMYQLWQDL